MNVHVRVQTIEDKMAEFVENNPIDIYIDYNDELSKEQVNAILEGKADDVRADIEMEYQYDDYSYYWKEMCENIGCSMDDVEDWLSSVDGFCPSYNLDDHG